MPFCRTCGKGQSRLKGGLCVNCLKSQQNNSDSSTMEGSINSDTQKCAQCGKDEHQLNENKLCSTCVNNIVIEVDNGTINNMNVQSGLHAAGSENGVTSNSNEATFWDRMDALLETKLNTFEVKVTENVMQEVRKITDPMKTEIENVKTENNKLKAELTILKANQKTHDEKFEVLEKSVKNQQKFLARADKDNRLKRLLIAGVPEEKNITIKGEVATNDRDKASLIIKSCGIKDVKTERVRRIGALDRGTDKRPRFILIEFNSWTDRNLVKKAGDNLKDHPETKYYFFKADVSKEDKEEYTRLYKVKEAITKDNPDSVVEIKYGKLFVDNVQVDKAKSAHQDF